MLEEISRRLQFNYSIRLVRDAAYGKEDENGRWSGIIGELSRRVIILSFHYNKIRLLFILSLL